MQGIKTTPTPGFFQRKSAFALLLFIPLVFGCTTIEIAEEDAFDVKRTVYPEDFRDTPYQLEKVSFPSGEHRLRAWWITQPDAAGTVLYYGGNGFVKETGYHIVFSILEQGMNLMVFNYRGYGRNPGKPTVKGLKTDGMAAYHFLRDSLQVSADKLVLHGHSLGTFVATYVHVNEEASGLVLQSPLTNARDMTDALVPTLLEPLINFEIDEALLKEDNLREIRKVQGPLLLTCGTEDRITPPVMAEKLYEAAGSPQKTLQLIEDGGHNNLDSMKSYQKAISSLYAKALQQ